MNLERLPSSLCMVEDKNTRQVFLGYNRDKLMTAGLFLVTLTRKIEGKYPVVSMYHVIAPDEHEAIQQVERNAYPEMEGCILDEEQEKSLTRAAVRIPVHIRGWGIQTF